MARVRLENVTKRFGDIVAVNNLSYEVRDKEFMCMLGPSGCGKTTSLRMIAGVETPDEGSIYIDDVRVNDVPSKDRDIAMVFQFYVMYPNMKAFDQIAFPLKIRNIPKDEIKRRVKEAAETLGIGHLLDKPIERLTMGERQRVELGRAMVKEPKVYLLDEPLTNLDAKLRTRMRAELKRLQKKLETTTIYVTHDQLEAITMADKIAVMNLGRLLQYDTPDAIYDHPKNLFVAGFIGSPAMNFIDCTFVEKDERAFLDAGEFLYDITELKNLIKEQKTSSELVLGVRPEHISVRKRGVKKDLIEAKVSIIEPIGNRLTLHLNVGERPVTVNTHAIEIAVGEKVWITFDRSKIHVFDKKTENTII